MTLEEITNKWLKDTSKMLNISGFGLRKWPELLKGKEHLVLYLDCSDNQLKLLPNFSNITWLYCSHNQLVSLPNFIKLTELHCNYNQLKSLPNFTKLTFLNCTCNQLRSLPNCPQLTFLYCWHNQLQSLPNFPNILDYGYNKGNQLFSNSLNKWRKVWKLQKLRQSELRKRGLVKVIKIITLRLYLPRLTNLHQDLIYSPHHPGKFYKKLRLGNWSGKIIN